MLECVREFCLSQNALATYWALFAFYVTARAQRNPGLRAWCHEVLPSLMRGVAIGADAYIGHELFPRVGRCETLRRLRCRRRRRAAMYP